MENLSLSSVWNKTSMRSHPKWSRHTWASSGAFRLKYLDESDYPLVRELIAQEIGPRYPETGFTYATRVVSGFRGDLTELGINTVKKWALAYYFKNDLAAFTVCTLKNNRSVKYGPTIVLPNYRGKSLATRLRLAADEQVASMGCTYAYSTCQAVNIAAQKYVIKAGYSLIARAPDLYKIGEVELVFAKRLSATARSTDGYAPWPKVGYSVKRGGAIALYLPAHITDVTAATNYIEEVISYKAVKNARKIFAATSTGDVMCQAITAFGFAIESVQKTDPGITGRLLFSLR